MKGVRRVCFQAVLVLLVFGAFVSSVLAWISVVKPPAIGEISVGELKYSIASGGTTRPITLPIAELMYVDLFADVRDDETGMLSSVSTGFILTLSGLSNTIPWRAQLKIESPGDLTGLLPLWILEGVNLDGGHVDQTDYHAIFASLGLDASASKEEWRMAIASYNRSVLDTIESIEVRETDTIRIQVVFWGDYDALTNPEDFLNITYELTITIQVFQTEKEVVA
jgi:hypothetical protein